MYLNHRRYATTTATTRKSSSPPRVASLPNHLALLFLLVNCCVLLSPRNNDDNIFLAVSSFQFSYPTTRFGGQQQQQQPFPSLSRRRKRTPRSVSTDDGNENDLLFVNTAPPSVVVVGDGNSGGATPSSEEEEEEWVDVCVIGGGVSGLTAALTVANQTQKQADADGLDNKTTTTTNQPRTVLLEATETLGGRVQSDRTDDGFVFDRGFAVFVEEYPLAKRLLDYDELKLGRFLPGALVHIDNNNDDDNKKNKRKNRKEKKNNNAGGSSSGSTTLMARVDDPLRAEGIKKLRVAKNAAFSPVGTLRDKVRLLPAIANVRRKSISQLFAEPETNTLAALKDRWGFSDNMLNRFFRPFLEGIFLSKLETQSSRMFGFVFKMFSEGYVSLPRNGMGAISHQLTQKALRSGVEIRTKQPVRKISRLSDTNINNNNSSNRNKGEEENDSGIGNIEEEKNNNSQQDYRYRIETASETSSRIIRARSVIIATDGAVAGKLLSSIIDRSTTVVDDDPREQGTAEHRSVGCVYYTFDTPVPIRDPVLVLNGIRTESDPKENPINNCCFPSVVQKGYAPPGKHVCSVTVLEPVMKEFLLLPTTKKKGGGDGGGSSSTTTTTNTKELDAMVRRQLCRMFPGHADEIRNAWTLRRVYVVPNAQPSQDPDRYPAANAVAGRDCTEFGGRPLPDGLCVCGDHVATPSLNGALQSGVNAGTEAAAAVAAASSSSSDSTAQRVPQEEEKVLVS